MDHKCVIKEWGALKKSQEARDQRGGWGVSTVLQSVGMFFKRYVNYQNLLTLFSGGMQSVFL
jgi:hypothetical protein